MISEYQVDTFAVLESLNYPERFIKDGGRLFLSTDVADATGVQHKEILSCVVREESGSDFFKKNTAVNTINGEVQLIMTKSAVMLILMSVDGFDRQSELAMALISEFNKLEEAIATGKTGDISVQQYSDNSLLRAAIQRKNDGCNYSNEANMINKIVLGASAKEIRERFELKPGESIRPYLDSAQITWIEKLQKRNTIYIEDGLEYEERKARLINYYARANQLALE